VEELLSASYVERDRLYDDMGLTARNAATEASEGREHEGLCLVRKNCGRKSAVLLCGCHSQ
jgi:hypothetical protein